MQWKTRMIGCHTIALESGSQGSSRGQMSTRRTFLMQASLGGLVAVADAQGPHAAGKQYASSSTSMKTCVIPRTDLTVTRIAYGCSSIVDWNRQPLSETEVTKAARIVNAAFDNGITFFDLANSYAFHKTEAAFGRVLRQSPGLRHKIIIQSKCGILLGDVEQLGGMLRNDHSRGRILSDVDDSLQRLGVDHLDILLLHWPDILVRPQEVAQAFDQLERDGKVRYFGVSNHTPSQIELLKTAVRQPLVINQIPLSLEASYLLAGGMAWLWNAAHGLQDYTTLPATVDYCRANDIQIQAYSPLRGNLLNPPADASPETRRAAAMLVELAQQKSTNPSAVALAWLLHHPAGIVPIVGSTNPEHLIENCAADGVTLTDEEWYTLLISTLKLTPRKIS